MMAFRLLLSCVLLTSGLNAEIPVFVRTGDSVQLDIQTQELPEFDDLSWSNDKSENIVKYFNGAKELRPHPSYKGRVDFNNKTFSLTLRNMQKTDSGRYTAKISGLQNKDIVINRIHVIDAVEAPVLAVNSNSSSPDRCNFTCKGNNKIISSIYNSSSCSSEEVTSSDNYTLRLSCIGDSIMCNYSNPVSRRTDTKKVNELCTVNKGKREEESVFPPWVIAFICLFTLTALIGFCIYKRKKGTQKNEQTIYAEVDENIKPQKSLEMLEKSDNPQTVYDTARDSGQTDVTNHTTPNDDPMNQRSSLTEKSKPDAPVTIYCAIQQQPKPPKIETDHTIYAAVNKPSAGYESAHPQSE